MKELYEVKDDGRFIHSGEETIVDTPEEKRQRKRAEAIEEGAEAVMETLGEYGAALWGEIIVEVIKAIFAIKTDAEDIAQERADKKALELAPGAVVNLNRAPEGIF